MDVFGMNEERITELEIKIAYQEDLLQALNTIPVSGKLAAQSLPVIGAVSSASVNWLFIEHYQKIAKVHFSIRALERRYGDRVVENLNKDIVKYNRKENARDWVGTEEV